MKVVKTRVTVKTELLDKEFKLSEYNYDSQYFPYYQARIAKMRPMIEANVRHKFGKDVSIVRLQEIGEVDEMEDSMEEEERNEVVIVGVICKEMSLQPSVVKALSEEFQLMPQPELAAYDSPSDAVWLQDGDESITLIGDIEVGQLVTGVCLAVSGHKDENAKFVVNKICFAQLPSYDESIPRPVVIEEDKYVAIVSGLGYSKNCNDGKEWSSAMQNFVSFMKGQINERYAMKESSIAKLIIAGNCIGKHAREEEIDKQEEGKAMPLNWNKKSKSNTTEAIKLVDQFLVHLAAFIDIDVMPGDLDPTSQLLPQQPIHPCILKEAFQQESVRCVTNPYRAKIDGIDFLGTSGQNVKSVRQFSTLKDPIEIMKKMLEWAHIAPTAPDSLACYPYKDQDPFVLTQCPDVFFVGNQLEFSKHIVEFGEGKNVLLLSIPEFESKHECVIINLRTKACEIISL